MLFCLRIAHNNSNHSVADAGSSQHPTKLLDCLNLRLACQEKENDTFLFNIQVENGEINVTVPQKLNFRIHASAPRTNISTKCHSYNTFFFVIDGMRG